MAARTDPYARTRTRGLTGIVQPLLFLFVLGYGMSGLIGVTAGFDFKKFVFPGIVAMSVGKTAGGATVATAQGTLMLALAPLIGVRLTPITIVEVIGIEFLMAVALTVFGVFVASRIARIEGFQVVMQLVLLPMLFLSGAMFPLNGLPVWLTFLTRINPLTYAVAPLRTVVFHAQHMPPAAVARFPTAVIVLGHPLTVGADLAIVTGFAALFFVLAVRGLSRTE